MYLICDHCEKERIGRKYQSVNKNGEIIAVELCEECAEKFLDVDVWVDTTNGYVKSLIDNKNSVRCEKCHDKKAEYLNNATKDNGITVSTYLCEDCLEQCTNNKDGYIDTSKGRLQINLLKNLEFASGISAKLEWTQIVKILNMILLVVLIIIGGIMGASIGDAISYEEGASALGAFLGLLLGGIVGGVVVSFSMLFVEISENLAAVLKEIKK